MGRLCERPGCSEPAALTYGMRPEDLVFWVDVLLDGTSHETGVLCQRHGDSMTVPRGWTLDDLRDPDLHLFRPPPRPDGPATRRSRSRRRSSGDDATGQLALRGLEPEEPAVPEEPVEPAAPVEPESSTEPESVTEPEQSPNETESLPAPDESTRSGALDWKPAFDDGDDLDGQLSARGPLLSRAFRGARG